MSDINFNENTLYFCSKEVSALNDSMKSFNGQLSGLRSLPGELTSALLIDCQNMIKMYTNKVKDLNDRVQEIKDVAISKFPSIETLFAFYDKGLINEFGEFDLGEETVKITSFDMMTAENGSTYFSMQTQNGDHIYLSADCLEGPNVLECYFPGIGGLNSDYSAVIQDIKGNGIPSNTIMAISRKHNNVGFLNTVDEITKNSNLTVSGVHLTTFSGSGATGFIALNEYLKEHPEINDVSMVVCDGYYIAEELINGDNPYICDEIINRNVHIAMVDPTLAYDRNGTDLNVAEMTAALQEMGYNTTYIKENSGTMHDANFVGKIVKDGLSEYLSGSSDELLNSVDYGYTKDVSIYQKDFNNLSSMDDIERASSSDIRISNEILDKSLTSLSESSNNEMISSSVQNETSAQLSNYDLGQSRSGIVSSSLLYGLEEFNKPSLNGNVGNFSADTDFVDNE